MISSPELLPCPVHHLPGVESITVKPWDTRPQFGLQQALLWLPLQSLFGQVEAWKRRSLALLWWQYSTVYPECTAARNVCHVALPVALVLRNNQSVVPRQMAGSRTWPFLVRS